MSSLLDTINQKTSFDKFRQKGVEVFEKLGFPSSKVEEYKYSPLNKIFSEAELSYSENIIEGDSYYDKEGVTKCSLKDFSEKNEIIFNKYFNKLAEKENDAMVGINTALCSNGNVIFISKGATTKEPITIDLSFQNNNFGVRELIILEKGAIAKIIINHNQQDVSWARVCEIFIGEGANLEIVETNIKDVSSRMVNTIIVEQKANSFFKHTIAVAKKGFCRNNIKVNLIGDYAECILNGVAVTCDDWHTDNATIIHHIAENCISRQLYRNIAKDESTAVFNGNIFVEIGAQKTEAYQKNNNILLSEEANIYTKPQLIINADDVKCSHGATVGQLDEEALFYARQRGLSLPMAQRLLLGSFIGEVLDVISDEELKESIKESLSERL
ncbi:MAG: Fe-S cluster assembly protein SufD [Bacteroidetes bacterium]|nr:Fe-S cluster assembly protein SufD [Bacteroidota bacterium]